MTATPSPAAVGPAQRHSTLRERIVEHVFVGEAMRRLWQRGVTDVELLRSEFDAGGYDLVMSRGRLTRHIQLKTLTSGGKTSQLKVGLRLAERESGCVIAIMVTQDLTPESFFWFGSAPGSPLPDISGMKVAKHSKANSKGKKLERPDHRVVPLGRFERLHRIDEVLERLFGPLE
jgi:hypothetical protein